MSTASRPAPPRRRRWPRWLRVAGWTLLGLLGATFLVFMLTVNFGGVHGIEFCPQTFERRSYSFYELPILGIQLTGVRHEDLSSTAENALTAQKFVTTPPGGKQDWHIVVGSRGPRLLRQGDAKILMQYLDAKDSEDYHRWVKWSEAHSQLAKLFWPAVQRLAIHELYVFVPDLFEIAKAISDPTKLQQELDRTVAQKLLFLSRRMQTRGDNQAALQILEEAIALDPTSEELARAKQELQATARSPK